MIQTYHCPVCEDELEEIVGVEINPYTQEYLMICRNTEKHLEHNTYYVLGSVYEVQHNLLGE